MKIRVVLFESGVVPPAQDITFKDIDEALANNEILKIKKWKSQNRIPDLVMNRAGYSTILKSL